MKGVWNVALLKYHSNFERDFNAYVSEAYTKSQWANVVTVIPIAGPLIAPIRIWFIGFVYNLYCWVYLRESYPSSNEIENNLTTIFKSFFFYSRVTHVSSDKYREIVSWTVVVTISCDYLQDSSLHISNKYLQQLWWHHSSRHIRMLFRFQST